MSQTPIYDQLMREFNQCHKALSMSRLIERPEVQLVERFVVQLDKATDNIPAVKKTAEVTTLAGVSIGSPSQE